ncbi:MAG: hypothetical protein ACLR0U_17920 [Enterocloster clostridioformis]
MDNERMNRPVSGADSHIRKYGLLNIVREYLESLPKSDLAFTGENEIVVLFRREGERGGLLFPDTLDLLNHALKTHLNLTLSMGMGQGVLQPDGHSGRICAGQKDGGAAFLRRSGCLSLQEGGWRVPLHRKRSVQRSMQEAIFRQDAGGIPAD